MPPALWIASTPDGSARHVERFKGDHARSYAVLPREAKPFWNFVKELGYSPAPENFTPVTKAAVQLELLVKVGPGKVDVGDRTAWSLDERMQLQYYRNPCDAYSMDIKDVWQLTEPVELSLGRKKTAMQTNNGGCGDILPVTAAAKLFLPILPGLPECFRCCPVDSSSDESLNVDVEADGCGHKGKFRKAESVMGGWGLDISEVCCLCLPAPIVACIAAGRWHFVLFRLGWQVTQRGSSSLRIRNKIFQEWQWPPTDAAIWESIGKHIILDSDGFIEGAPVFPWMHFSPHNIDRLLHRFCKITHSLVEGAADVQEQDEVNIEIGVVAKVLKGWSLAITSRGDVNATDKLHSSLKLLSALRVARMLGSAANPTDLVERSLLLPPTRS